MDVTSFGQLIKLLRERKKMTQENLANMLNVSTSTVCKWERGNNLPDVNMFKKISEVLEISLDALHNPQEALSQINNPVTPAKKGINFIKKRYVLFFSVILLFFINVGIILYIHNTNAENMNIIQVAFRTTEDEICGTVYEVACVYSGNIENISLDSTFVLALSNDWKKDTFISSDITIMKASFYSNREDALKWSTPQKCIYINR